MIISNSKTPTINQFNILCSDTNDFLNSYAKQHPNYFCDKDGRKLEPEIKRAMDKVSEGTAFEGTIEIISGQRFPDIVADKIYGLEVKSTKSDQWTTIGGSVMEGTRVQDVEYINLIFGKLWNPVEFRVKRYQDCLSEIAVTHSPRYKIDMQLEEGNTIFDKMNVDYEYLRKLDDPLQPVIEYYKRLLKPGEKTWWINGTSPSEQTVPMAIQKWRNIDINLKNYIRTEGLAYYPEVFSNSTFKYDNLYVWLVQKYGIIGSRDIYSAGGQFDVNINNHHYRLSRIYKHVIDYSELLKEIVENADCESLSESWGVRIVEGDDRMEIWQMLVYKYSGRDENVYSFGMDVFGE